MVEAAAGAAEDTVAEFGQVTDHFETFHLGNGLVGCTAQVPVGQWDTGERGLEPRLQHGHPQLPMRSRP